MSKENLSVTDTIRAEARAWTGGHNALARAAELDKGTLSRFKNGQVGLTVENLDRLAEALGLVITKRKGGKKHGKSGK